MRRLIAFVAIVAALVLVDHATGQQFGPSTGKGSGVSVTPSFSSSMTQSMAKPSFAALMSRPTFPAPLNLFNMMPTFSNLQNTMLGRSVFGGPQMTATMPKQAKQVTPPPPKKK